MLLTGLDILTMLPGSREPVHGAIRIRDGRIEEVGDLQATPGETTFDASGLTAVPGFVQGHVHLCQTLFRNLAESLPLLRWLQQRIWPLEAAHDEVSLRASARLALHELLRGGCTTFQSMESVHGTEHVFAEVERSGLRAILGNSLIDVPGDGVPDRLCTTTHEALAISLALRRTWDGRAGRIHYAFNPRFLLSCSDELHAELAHLRRSEGARIHTHAAEHPAEVETVLQQRGQRYLVVLERLGVLGPTTALAHCVHLDDEERDILQDSKAAVMHCPTTNLKLGSGFADVPEFRARKIRVAIGADGAPANNRLDALTELRQAALIQDLNRAPGALSPRDALAVLTIEGAKALGLEHECGSLEAGKAADVVLLDLRDPALGPGGDAFTKIVYCAERAHIRHVLVAGEFALRDGHLLGALGDTEALAAECSTALHATLERAGLSA